MVVRAGSFELDDSCGLSLAVSIIGYYNNGGGQSSLVAAAALVGTVVAVLLRHDVGPLTWCVTEVRVIYISVDFVVVGCRCWPVHCRSNHYERPAGGRPHGSGKNETSAARGGRGQRWAVVVVFLVIARRPRARGGARLLAFRFRVVIPVIALLKNNKKDGGAGDIAAAAAAAGILMLF